MTNRVVAITGGNSGIGRAASLLFAKEAAKVTVMLFHNREVNSNDN